MLITDTQQEKAYQKRQRVRIRTDQVYKHKIDETVDKGNGK